MSNAMAIAAVSVVLKDRLQNGLIRSAPPGLGNVTVSVLPPDRMAIGAAEKTQLNLFLYQVTPNAAWRNVGLASRDDTGRRLSNAPMALDLNYLLTAYGAKEFHAETLLGCGMQVLHEMPVLGRQPIRDALPSPAGGSLPTELAPVAGAGLADQIEQIKIAPQILNGEEMSKLWTALQAHYRPSAAYSVTVVLIEADSPARSPLPVLARGAGDRGVSVQPDLLPSSPSLTAIVPPDGQPSATLGDVLALEGHHLDGANHTVRFANPLLEEPILLLPSPGTTGERLRVTIPNDPVKWVCGFYTVSVSLLRPGETNPRTTNEVPMALAPRITSTLPLNVTRESSGAATVNVTCAAQVLPAQRVSLLVGDFEQTAESHASPTASLSFVFAEIPSGDYWVRLRVDGLDSLLIDRTLSPPEFIGDRKVRIT